MLTPHEDGIRRRSSGTQKYLKTTVATVLGNSLINNQKRSSISCKAADCRSPSFEKNDFYHGKV